VKGEKMIDQIKRLGLWSLLFLACVNHHTFAQEKSTPDETPSQKVAGGEPISLAKPTYPPLARALRIGGQVLVKVIIDESGNVISATAETGHPLLHKAAEEAALKSKISPVLIDGVPVKATARITFNFVGPADWEAIASGLATIEMGKPQVSYGLKASEFTGEGLQEEAKEYDLLTKDITTDGKAIRATKLIKSIQSKLEALQPIDAWYFRLGLTKTRLREYAERPGGEADFQSHLPELMVLYNSVPGGIPGERVEALSKAIQISLKAPLTKEDRKGIVDLLIESYNRVHGKPLQ
jgi:TonB family protein